MARAKLEVRLELALRAFDAPNNPHTRCTVSLGRSLPVTKTIERALMSASRSAPK